MIYNCKVCNYYTEIKANYEKHCKTKKHNIKNTDTVDVPQIDKYICEHCNISYKSKQNLDNHLEFCKELTEKNKEIVNIKNKYKDKIIKLKDEYKTKIEKYENDIEFLKNDLTEVKNELIKLKDESNNKLIDEMKKTQNILINENKQKQEIIKESGNIIKSYAMSTISFIKKYYNDAPALETIKDFTILVDDEDVNFCENILGKYMSKKLVKYISDCIINEYKTTDPHNQSFWTTDKNRINYIVRSIVNDRPEWIPDANGLNIRDKIVKPIINYIDQQIEQYYNEKTNEVRKYTYYVSDDNIYKRNLLNDYINAALNLMLELRNDKITDLIMKLISPYFSITLKSNVHLMD